MSIRIKLLVSYIAMLIIPLLLTLVAAVLIAISYAGGYKEVDLNKNPLRQFSEETSTLYTNLENLASENPDKLKDTSYMSSMEKQLMLSNTGMIVIDETKTIYMSQQLSGIDVSKLKKPGKLQSARDFIFAKDSSYAVSSYDLAFSDGTHGTLYLLIDMRPIGKFASSYIGDVVKAMLFILLVTNAFLTFLVSRSIIKPLDILKKAANEIKGGNLNYSIKPKSKDEIGELTIAFEDMRQKLKQSVELKERYEENRKELVSNISHDLKTPITSIKGYVEGILDGVADNPEKLEKYVRTINAKADDMDKMIDDLFLFSKLDLNRIPFDFEKIDINSFFQDCVEELKMDLAQKGIDLDLFKCPVDISVKADRDKLKRVVLNIVGNSVKYMAKETGKIEIRIIEGAQTVTVKISDDGQGIETEALPFIFERFYRADKSRNSEKGGSGLGLAIVRQIINGHEGRIWAESAVGKGTSIYFTLKKLV